MVMTGMNKKLISTGVFLAVLAALHFGAAGMAIADDPDAVHGPLELLCTVDEETGLTGAKDLDPSIVSGRIMLNLDTEEDGAIYIGCACGADSVAKI